MELNPTLDAGEWSASCTGRFTGRSTHWTGGWVGSRICLDAMTKRKIPCPFRKSNPGLPVRRLLTTLTELSRLINIYYSTEFQEPM